jgi:uncharacterized protein YxjI
MKLYVKEKFFTWVRDFSVYDASGNERYHVSGEFMSLANKLHVTDRDGVERAYVHSVPFSWHPTYVVEIGGREACRIVKEFTFFRPSYRFEGLDWRIEGGNWSHDYTVMSGRGPVASIRKAWFTLGDAYEIDIADDADELTALAAMLAIDSVLASQNAAAAASAGQ